MKPPRRTLLALALVAAGLQPAVLESAATKPPVRLEQLRLGMTPQQVRHLLGPPQRVARQIFYQGYLEQWVYDRPLPCRIDFLHRLGKEAQIQSVRPLSAQKR